MCAPKKIAFSRAHPSRIQGFSSIWSWIWMNSDDIPYYQLSEVTALYSHTYCFLVHGGWMVQWKWHNTIFNALFSSSPVHYNKPLRVHNTSCLHWFLLHSCCSPSSLASTCFFHAITALVFVNNKFGSQLVKSQEIRQIFCSPAKTSHGSSLTALVLKEIILNYSNTCYGRKNDVIKINMSKCKCWSHCDCVNVWQLLPKAFSKRFLLW